MNLDSINDVLASLDKLQGVSATALVFFVCLCVAYAWRALNVKWFPNDAIPVAVMLCGALVMAFIADGRPTTMPHHVWTVRNLAVGFVIGAVSVVLQNYVFDWLASKIPGLSNTALFTKNPTEPAKPDAGQPPLPPVK